MTTGPENPTGDFPGSMIEIDDVALYEGEDNTWRYIPGKPVAELSGGRPTLQLYVSASGGLLQLGVQWSVKADFLENLPKEIARRTGRDAIDIHLQPAPASVKQVTVEIGEGNGPFATIGTSSSSGFPPYSAIFRVPLDAAKKNAVVAALNGRSGFLLVRYQASARFKVTAHAVLEGDVGSASENLNSSSNSQEIFAWIKAALAEGRLKLSVQAAGGAGASLLSKAEQGVLRRFAQALQTWLGRQDPFSAGQSILRVEGVESEFADRNLERVCDVSEWFETGEGQRHIVVLPGGDASPPPSEIRVGLGFPAVELPIAFIEIRIAEKKALLRPPDFEPVVLSAKASSLQVTTHYATGQPPYTSQVPPTESERLDPANLGLIQIVVDGTGRRDAGIKDILLHLNFLPSGQGAPEDRTFHLHEQQWVASFYMPTRGEPIAGEFILEWTETNAAQEQARRQFKAKDQAVLVLQGTETSQET